MQCKKCVGRLSVFVLTGLMCGGTALAAGYQLNEYSAAGMGRAFAGAAVVGDDFSAIGYNPAGMFFNQTSGVQLGASVVSLHSDFKGYTHAGAAWDHDHTRITRVLPNGFVQYKLNDALTAGIGVYVPFGLATDYKNGWFGEEHGGLSQISTTNVSPAISYRLADTVAIGASVNFQNADARLTATGSDVSGDDWATGYTIGMAYRPADNVRLGLSYRSAVKHNLKGRLKTAALGNFYDISAEITTPETIWLTGAWDVNQKWTLSGTFRWTRWSRFDTLSILSPSFSATHPLHPAAVSVTEEKWRDTRFYALGADYKYNDRWTFRVGTAYDSTVIRSPDYRTPRIPDGRRVWSALGASYTWNNIQADVGYAHIFVHGGKSNGTDSNHLRPNIKYSSDANMFSFVVQYKF